MSTKPDLDDIARRIKTAQDENTRIEPTTTRFSGFELADAYEVARRIHEARLAEGAATVGRKLGFTNSSIWPQYGVSAPVWGYLYDTRLIHARGGRVACRIGAFAEPKIEPEVVVHFASTPPVDSDLSAILDCVDWVAHAFEIVQSHYPGWRFQAPDTVAASALHGALLLGEPVTIDKLGADPIAALENFSVTLSRDGEPVDTGKGSNVLGGPLAAVAHLIAALAEQPQYPALQAGEMVTTGTLTAAHPIQAGERWSTEIEGIALPGLSVALEA